MDINAESGSVNFPTEHNENPPASSEIDASTVEKGSPEMQEPEQQEWNAAVENSPDVVLSGFTHPAETHETRPALVSLDYSLWVTVDLSNPNLLEGVDAATLATLKAAAFPVRNASDEITVNLYDPFTSGRAKGALTGPVGIFRNALDGIFAVANQINSKPTTYLGEEYKIKQTLGDFAKRLTNDLIEALEVKPTAELPEGLSAFGSTLSAFTDINSWISVSSDDVSVSSASIYSNLVVTAPAILDSKDPQKRVQRLLSTLERVSHSGEDLTPVYVAIALNSASLLENDRIHDLATFLHDQLGFNAASRIVFKDNAVEWLPTEALDSLFPENADIILFRDLIVEEEAEEEAGNSPDEAE